MTGVPVVTWRKPLESLLTAPLPRLWWVEHTGLFIKKAAHQTIDLADATATLCWGSYFDTISAVVESEREGITGDGRMVIQWMSLFGAVQDHQLEALRQSCQRHAPDSWEPLKGDHDGLRSLVLWNLAFRFTNGVLGAAVMADPPWEDRQLMEVHEPAGFAMGYSTFWSPLHGASRALSTWRAT